MIDAIGRKGREPWMMASMHRESFRPTLVSDVVVT